MESEAIYYNIIQYIGETKRRLKDRFNEHRRAVDKTNIKSKPTYVSERFLSHSNHSRTNMQLIPLAKTHSLRDSVRKARESHLIDNYEEPQAVKFLSRNLIS